MPHLYIFFTKTIVHQFIISSCEDHYEKQTNTDTCKWIEKLGSGKEDMRDDDIVFQCTGAGLQSRTD